MVASNKYSKLDTKDAKILALMTNVIALKQSVSENPANVTSGGGSGGRYRGNQGEKIVGVEKWSTANKDATIQHEGDTVWWCHSHKNKDGLFDGLYIWNKPEDHDAWFDKFKSCRCNKDKTTTATKAAPPSGFKLGSLDKLTLYQILKEFLRSNLMLYDADVD